MHEIWRTELAAAAISQDRRCHQSNAHVIDSQTGSGSPARPRRLSFLCEKKESKQEAVPAVSFRRGCRRPSTVTCTRDVRPERPHAENHAGGARERGNCVLVHARVVVHKLGNRRVQDERWRDGMGWGRRRGDRRLPRYPLPLLRIVLEPIDEICEVEAADVDWQAVLLRQLLQEIREVHAREGAQARPSESPLRLLLRDTHAPYTARQAPAVTSEFVLLSAISWDYRSSPSSATADARGLIHSPHCGPRRLPSLHRPVLPARQSVELVRRKAEKMSEKPRFPKAAEQGPRVRRSQRRGLGAECDAGAGAKQESPERPPCTRPFNPCTRRCRPGGRGTFFSRASSPAPPCNSSAPHLRLVTFPPALIV